MAGLGSARGVQLRLADCQASWKVSQATVLSVDEFDEAHLSLATKTPIQEKDQRRENRLSRGRLTIEEHLDNARRQAGLRGKPFPEDRPTLAISCRNVLSNPRCGAWVRGFTSQFLTVQGEDPRLSRRPYHLLGFRSGRFSIEEEFVEPDRLKEYDWAFSGVPIYWDGQEIAPRMLAETTDFAHVFRLPRGFSPSAVDSTTERWQSLRDLTRKTLYLPRAEAYARILEVSEGLPLETTYLHNCAGVTDDGRLVVMMANASLEDIGMKLHGHGARRAIVLDNGGSCSLFFYPNGVSGSVIQLAAGPNFRPAGTAYLFIVLSGPSYSILDAL